MQQKHVTIMTDMLKNRIALSWTISITELLYSSIFVGSCVYVCGLTYHDTRVEVREHPMGVVLSFHHMGLVD